MTLILENTVSSLGSTYFSSECSQKKLSSINPLVTAAMPLLLMMIRIKELPLHPDPAVLRTHIIREIGAFEEQAKMMGASPRLILAARYCLCTAMDEFALSTSWGSESIWSQQTLLSIIHKETWGGERFFIILEKMAEDDKSHIDFLELLYFILSLGYEGKYYAQERMVREEIRHRLFRLIQIRRGIYSENLSFFYSESPPVSFEKKPSSKRWLIPCLMLGILFLLFAGFNYKTYKEAISTLAILKKIDSLEQSLENII